MENRLGLGSSSMYLRNPHGSLENGPTDATHISRRQFQIYLLLHVPRDVWAGLETASAWFDRKAICEA